MVGSMPQLKFPTWFWYFLIIANLFNFGIGFILADRQLMFIALVSGLCCWAGFKISEKEKTDE